MWSFVEKGCGIILGVLEMYLSPGGGGGPILGSLMRMKSCHKCLVANLHQEQPHGPVPANGMDKIWP